jgi:hypothetical protein
MHVLVSSLLKIFEALMRQEYRAGMAKYCNSYRLFDADSIHNGSLVLTNNQHYSRVRLPALQRKWAYSRAYSICQTADGAIKCPAYLVQQTTLKGFCLKFINVSIQV